MNKIQRAFNGVWIPKEIWLSKELTWMEKLFITEIKSLDNENGCYASNNYFADFFQISAARSSQIINGMVKKGYLKSTIKKEGKRTLGRVLKCTPKVLRIFNTPTEKETEGGIKNIKGGVLNILKGGIKNIKPNNTNTNNTFNNNNKGIFENLELTKNQLSEIENLGGSKKVNAEFEKHLKSKNFVYTSPEGLSSYFAKFLEVESAKAQNKLKAKKKQEIVIPEHCREQYENCQAWSEKKFGRPLRSSEKKKLLEIVQQGLTGFQLWSLVSHNWVELQGEKENLNFILGKFYADRKDQFKKFSEKGKSIVKI